MGRFVDNGLCRKPPRTVLSTLITVGTGNRNLANDVILFAIAGMKSKSTNEIDDISKRESLKDCGTGIKINERGRR